MAVKKFEKIRDGYVNLGKKVGTKESILHGLTGLIDIYSKDKLMKRAIDIPVNDAFRAECVVTDSKGDKIEVDTKIFTVLHEAKIMSRVNGGSFIYLTNNKAFHLENFQVNIGDIELNPLREDYLKPKTASLTIGEVLDLDMLLTITENGSNLQRESSSFGFGVSIVDMISSDLLSYRLAVSEAVDILGELNQNIIKMNDLNMVLEESREDEIVERLDVINFLKSNKSVLLLDKEDDYINSTKTLSGVQDVIIQASIMLCASVGIPYTRFFGKSASGLTNSGQSDLSIYYDEVVSEIQENYIKPKLEEILFKLYGHTELIITFSSLIQKSDKEIEETKGIRIDNAIKLRDAGLISDGDIDAKNLF